MAAKQEKDHLPKTWRKVTVSVYHPTEHTRASVTVAVRRNERRSRILSHLVKGVVTDFCDGQRNQVFRETLEDVADRYASLVRGASPGSSSTFAEVEAACFSGIFFATRQWNIRFMEVEILGVQGDGTPIAFANAAAAAVLMVACPEVDLSTIEWQDGWIVRMNVRIGKKVKLASDGRMWVCDWFGRWKEAPPEQIGLNEYYPCSVIVGGGKYDVSDIGLDFRQLSGMLGVPRLDNKRASEIWHPESSLRGGVLAIDFVARELVFNLPEGQRLDPKMVDPFGAVAAILDIGDPRFVEKRRRPGSDGYLRIGRFPLSADERWRLTIHRERNLDIKFQWG
jgi:hypothetical protein